MSNDISSVLQSLAPQHKVPGQSRNSSQPVAPASGEKPVVSQSDRVTLTDTARQLQQAEAKSPRAAATPSNVLAVEVGTSPSANSSAPTSAPDQQAQRPTPAMANMLQAFLTTADMEGFDAHSDLNADGVINFQDLAALRDLETGAQPAPLQGAEAQIKDMTNAFLSSDDGKEFDAASDLNDDGMINFQDLALLRAKLLEE